MNLHILLALILGAAGFLFGQPVQELLPPGLSKDPKLVAITQAITEGYGKDFGGVKSTPNGQIVFILAGKEIPYDDGRKKSFEEQLEAPDLEDTFALVYPLGTPMDQVKPNFDPGRIRVEAMFKALYGAEESEVRRHCVTVGFCGRKVLFSARCGAAEALEKVGADLEKLFEANPGLSVYTEQLGTFNWRPIAGTTRMSNHSFACAIDLNTAKSAYWRWDPPERLNTFSRKTWPAEIVAIFENHGFIWGGNWWHYDTMHFEYRPELIAYAKILKK